jgi:hypothetical protein
LIRRKQLKEPAEFTVKQQSISAEMYFLATLLFQAGSFDATRRILSIRQIKLS